MIIGGDRAQKKGMIKIRLLEDKKGEMDPSDYRWHGSCQSKRSVLRNIADGSST
jgi:hypothetical protein